MNRLFKHGIFWAVFFWLLLLWITLFFRSLLPIDETRYVSVAWEMWHRNDFLVPYLNGKPYSHKPPLFFWLIHLGWWLFGVNDFTPRITAPVFACFSLFLTRHLTRMLWPEDRQAHHLSPIILSTFILWAIFSTLTMFDIILTFFALVGAWGILTARRGKILTGWGLVCMAIGGGILTKGPVILLHILPPAILVFWWSKDDPLKNRLHWYLGLMVAIFAGVAIALAWAVPAAISGGREYGHAIFWGQTSGRIIKSFAHRQPFWWYFPLLPLILFPWSLWTELWKGVKKLKPDTGVRFCLSWHGSVLIILSLISGKQIYYLLPVFPSFAMLMAKSVGVLQGPISRKSYVPIAFIYFILGAVVFSLPLILPHFPVLTPFQNLPVLWGLFPVCLGAFMLIRQPGGIASASTGLGVSVVALIFFVHAGIFHQLAPAYTVKTLGSRIGVLQRAGKKVAHISDYDDQYHFAGRLTQPLTIIHNYRQLKKWANLYPDGYVIIYYKTDTDIPKKGAEYTQLYRGKKVALWKVEKFIQKLALFKKKG